MATNKRYSYKHSVSNRTPGEILNPNAGMFSLDLFNCD